MGTFVHPFICPFCLCGQIRGLRGLREQILADLKPEKLDLRSERADWKPERADLKPEKPDLRPMRVD